MFKLQPSVTAGTPYFAEMAPVPGTPFCSRCDNDIDPEGAVHIRRRVGHKTARLEQVLCLGCALHLGYITAR